MTIDRPDPGMLADPRSDYVPGPSPFPGPSRARPAVSSARVIPVGRPRDRRTLGPVATRCPAIHDVMINTGMRCRILIRQVCRDNGNATW